MNEIKMTNDSIFDLTSNGNGMPNSRGKGHKNNAIQHLSGFMKCRSCSEKAVPSNKESNNCLSTERRSKPGTWHGPESRQEADAGAGAMPRWIVRVGVAFCLLIVVCMVVGGW